MFKTTDEYAVSIKRGFRKIKSYLTFGGGLCLVVSIIYFLYYGLLASSNDPVALEYTEGFFNPVAQWLHPDLAGMELFKQTAITLLKYTIPCYILYIIAGGVEKLLLDINTKVNETKIRSMKKAEENKYLQQFENIKYYSIAISFDYKKNGSDIPNKAINQLNKVIFERVTNSITTKKIKVQASGIITITSSDFTFYDALYENVLKTIRRVRELIKEKYCIDIFTTITTDAYTRQPIIDNIIGTHFAIKGCNLKDKAINTNQFYKKYNYMGYSKFAGTSAGIYNNFNEKQREEEEYDLNIVINNLSNEFDSI